MTYYPFTKLDEDYVSSMAEKQDDGSVIEVPITTKLYRCDGLLPINDQPCNLVWTRASQAKECASRGHRASYRAGYRDQAFIRKAVRRDGPAARRPEVMEAQAADPALVLANALKSLTPEQFKDLAAAMGLRVVRKPQVPGKAPSKAKAKSEPPFSEDDLPF